MDPQILTALAWLKDHKVTIGAALVALGGYLTGAADLGTVVMALIGVLSPGVKWVRAPR